LRNNDKRIVTITFIFKKKQNITKQTNSKKKKKKKEKVINNNKKVFYGKRKGAFVKRLNKYFQLQNKACSYIIVA
jgi:hypothetical protein